MIVGLFVASGAAGLMYEVVWARQLVIVFGNTTQAISAILTGFFGGMAVGAWAGGHLADRVRSPLRLYAGAELTLAAVAVITPLLFQGIREIYRAAYPTLTSDPEAFALLRFALAVLALAPATVLMGATLPSLVRHLTRSRDQLGGQFGRLYTANTVGGILGTAAAGYLLIELVGLQSTVWVAVALSFSAGVGGLILSGQSPAAVALRPTRDRPAPRLARQGRRTLVLLVAFVSGLTSLGYQTLWTRLMSSGTDNASYVFTNILLLFLAGIAIGAFLHGSRLGRGTRRMEALAISQLVVAVIAFLGLPLLGDLRNGAAAWAVIVPATLVMGFSLPVAAGLMGEDEHRLGRDSGKLLAVNTMGTVVGTFVVPFFLIPLVGSGHSVLLLAAVNASLGTLLLVHASRAERRWLPASVAGAVVVAVVLIGPVVSPEIAASPMARVVARDGQLFASAEDEIASVQAGRMNGRDQLWVGAVSMSVLTVDTKLMPLIPLIARPESESVLVVAFGMGSSHRTALIAGLDTESVELVPSVPEMFGYYYPDAEAVLADPHGEVVIADGRNHVALTREKYDIIMADPPPPIRSAGTGVLYAREFYQACADRLTTGGVMMQWMPHDQTIDEFRAHMRTLDDVFRHVAYVLSPAGHGVYMLGAQDPIEFTTERIEAVLDRAGITEDLASTSDAPEETAEGWTQLIRSLVWLADDQARAFAGAGPLITDDRPLTEYFLLRTLAGTQSPPMGPSQLRAEAMRTGG